MSPAWRLAPFEEAGRLEEPARGGFGADHARRDLALFLATQGNEVVALSRPSGGGPPPLVPDVLLNGVPVKLMIAESDSPSSWAQALLFGQRCARQVILDARRTDAGFFVAVEAMKEFRTQNRLKLSQGRVDYIRIITREADYSTEVGVSAEILLLFGERAPDAVTDVARALSLNFTWADSSWTAICGAHPVSLEARLLATDDEDDDEDEYEEDDEYQDDEDDQDAEQSDEPDLRRLADYKLTYSGNLCEITALAHFERLKALSVPMELSFAGDLQDRFLPAPPGFVDERAQVFTQPHQRELAQHLAAQGNQVQALSSGNALVNGVPVALRASTSDDPRVWIQTLYEAQLHARQVLIDLRRSPARRAEAERLVDGLRAWNRQYRPLQVADFVRLLGGDFDVTAYVGLS